MALIITDLSARVDDTQILHSLHLTVKSGQVHALMGPNGSGKSTLAYTLMGHPSYQVTGGTISYNNEDIAALSPDKRARKGLFLAFQQPYEIPGLAVTTFLRESYKAVTGSDCSVSEFNTYLHEQMALLAIDPAFAARNVNEGFSGGEKKRLEMLQLLVLRPSLVVLDEIDSGLDVDALRFVAHGLNQARKQNPAMAVIIITHYHRILAHSVPDYVHIMHHGSIVKSGDVSLAHQIEQKGYDAFCPTKKK